DPEVGGAAAVRVEVPAVRLGVADQPGVVGVLGDRVVAFESADQGGHDAQVAAAVTLDRPAGVAAGPLDVDLFAAQATVAVDPHGAEAARAGDAVRCVTNEDGADRVDELVGDELV